jgi:hypothetical protein
MLARLLVQQALRDQLAQLALKVLLAHLEPLAKLVQLVPRAFRAQPV